MARAPASSFRITRTKTGATVRATGAAAQALFDAMVKAQAKPPTPAEPANPETKESSDGGPQQAL